MLLLAARSVYVLWWLAHGFDFLEETLETGSFKKKLIVWKKLVSGGEENLEILVKKTSTENWR